MLRIFGKSTSQLLLKIGQHKNPPFHKVGLSCWNEYFIPPIKKRMIYELFLESGYQLFPIDKVFNGVFAESIGQAFNERFSKTSVVYYSIVPIQTKSRI